MSKLHFRPISKFGLYLAQNCAAPLPHRHPPRARRNASTSDICSGCGNHAQSVSSIAATSTLLSASAMPQMCMLECPLSPPLALSRSRRPCLSSSSPWPSMAMDGRAESCCCSCAAAPACTRLSHRSLQQCRHALLPPLRAPVLSLPPMSPLSPTSHPSLFCKEKTENLGLE